MMHVTHYYYYFTDAPDRAHIGVRGDRMGAATPMPYAAATAGPRPGPRAARGAHKKAKTTLPQTSQYLTVPHIRYCLKKLCVLHSSKGPLTQATESP